MVKSTNHDYYYLQNYQERIVYLFHMWELKTRMRYHVIIE